MIDLYSGTPGSGKTTHAAAMIIEARQSGRYVVSNMDIAVDSIPFNSKRGCYTHISTYELTPRFLFDFAGEHPSREDGKLLVIDECQLIFNSRDWNSSDRNAWIEFFTQHRKLGYHVVLITQNVGMLDKQIRPLIEYNHQHRKVSSFGILSKVISLFFFNRLFCSVVTWAGTRTVVGNELFIAWPWVTKVFDTTQMLGAKHV